MAVRHAVADGPYRTALEPLVREVGPLRLMEPAERELRADLQALVEAGGLEVIPHQGWLTTAQQLRDSQPGGPPWQMDAFCRVVRRATGILRMPGIFLGRLDSHGRLDPAWDARALNDRGRAGAGPGVSGSPSRAA